MLSVTGTIQNDYSKERRSAKIIFYPGFFWQIWIFLLIETLINDLILSINNTKKKKKRLLIRR